MLFLTKIVFMCVSYLDGTADVDTDGWTACSLCRKPRTNTADMCPLFSSVLSNAFLRDALSARPLWWTMNRISHSRSAMRPAIHSIAEKSDTPNSWRPENEKCFVIEFTTHNSNTLTDGHTNRSATEIYSHTHCTSRELWRLYAAVSRAIQTDTRWSSGWSWFWRSSIVCHSRHIRSRRQGYVMPRAAAIARHPEIQSHKIHSAVWIRWRLALLGRRCRIGLRRHKRHLLYRLLLPLADNIEKKNEYLRCAKH